MSDEAVRIAQSYFLDERNVYGCAETTFVVLKTRVARELGTSQAPVREAPCGLAALGVVEILPFRGARVRRPTAHELMKACAVRAELESLGARLGLSQMTDEDLAELEVLHDAMQQAAETGDRHEVAVADASFHARLLRLAHNITLERVWRSLEPFSRTYITLVAPGSDAHWTADLHPRIIAALRTRDPDAVETALRRHFDEASAHLADGWRDATEAPTLARRSARRGR